MKFSFATVVLFIGSISFIGCGSSSSSSGGNGGGSNTLGKGTPVTTKVVCDPAPIVMGSMTFDVKYAADGDITAICKSENGFTYGEYSLRDGVNTLTVNELQKVEYLTADSTTTKGGMTTTYNYKTGTVHIQIDGIEDGKSYKYDCIETYPTPLPTTLTDKESIENLFGWDLDDDKRVKTTCPASYYDDGNDDDDDDDKQWKGTMVQLINYTVTDHNGEKHLFSENISLNNK